MSRRCEVKLVDVVTVGINKKKYSKNKQDIDYKAQPKIKDRKNVNTGHKSVSLKDESNKQKEENDEVSFTILKERIPRSFKRGGESKLSTQNSSKRQCYQNMDITYKEREILKNREKTQKIKNIQVSSTNIKNKAPKRPPSPSKISDVEPLKKKPNNIKTALSSISNQVENTNLSNQVKVNKRKRRKNRKKYWESKLTGARRVSKRLTNLKIKNKILNQLGTGINTHDVFIKNKIKESVNSSIDKKTKRIKIKDKYSKNKDTKVNKSAVLKRKRAELTPLFGKLSYAKNRYPKITSGRRTPASYTVKIKTTGTVSPKVSKLKKPVNVFIEYECEKKHELANKTDVSAKEESASTVSSVTGKTNTEETGDTLEGETQQESVTDTNIFKEQDNTGDTEPQEYSEMKSSENTTATVQTIVCNTAQEDSVGSSEFVIVDLESGENVVYDFSEDSEVVIPDTNSEGYSQNNEKEPNSESENATVSLTGKISHEVLILESLDNTNLNNKSQTESNTDVTDGTNSSTDEDKSKSSSDEHSSSTQPKVENNIVEQINVFLEKNITK